MVIDCKSRCQRHPPPPDRVDHMPYARTHPCAAALTLASIAASVIGCSAEAGRVIQFPDLAHPGPAPIQRARAIQHDPYPLNDIGPEVVGGRPREYQQPLPEVDRAHLGPQRPTLQPLPLPGAAVTAPPVASSPFAVAPAQPAVPLGTAAPPIVTSAAPPVVAAPAPVTSTVPSYASPPPVVTTPLPASSSPPAGFPAQQRPGY